MSSVRGGVKVTLAASCLALLGYIYISTITNNNVKYARSAHEQKINLPRLNHIVRINNSHHLLSKNNTGNNITTDKFVSREPLLTLFTTWPDDLKKYKIWNTTLKNWAYFKPLIRPVLFVTSGRQKEHIVKHGWDVLPVSKTSASGLPVLKNMFLDVISKFTSPFYGYSNGDIIYDDGIIHTLRSVSQLRKSLKQPIFITGTRTNVANLTEKETDDVKNLAGIAKNRGKLFMSMSQDYFITDRSYPWRNIPDIVIGRRAYDNWLVLNARQLNHTLIDVTQTVTAVHQTTESGNFEGWNTPDRDYNVKLLSELYTSMKFYCGDTKYAPWMSVLSDRTTITVVRKPVLKKTCYP